MFTAHLTLSVSPVSKKDFSTSLEMTIRGRRYSHFPPARDAFSHSLSYRECPIRPFRAPSPSRGRLLVHGGGILVSPPSPWEKDFGLFPPSFGRRYPEGAEVGSRSGMRRKVRQPILRFVIPSAARNLSCCSGVRHACGCSKNRSGAHLTLSVSPVCKEDFSLCSK